MVFSGLEGVVTTAGKKKIREWDALLKREYFSLPATLHSCGGDCWPALKAKWSHPPIDLLRLR